MWGQLLFARGEISSLESLLAFRDAWWEIITRLIGFQDELCQARKKITKFGWLARGKELMLDLEVGGLPLIIAPLSIRPPQMSLHPLLSNQSLTIALEASPRLLAMVSYQSG